MELYAIDESYISNYLFTLENATAEERAAAITEFGSKESSKIYTVDPISGVARLEIKGPLTTEGPSALARFFGFGGASYNEIAEAADELRGNRNIKAVRLAMDTPGGTMAGIDTARSALVELAAEKSLIAENHGFIASAGYYLASAADSIEAVTPFAKTGSIGIIIAGLDVSEAMANRGLKQIKIVSKNAPDKVRGLDSPHGRDVLQEEINATERVFIQTIAEGRGVTPQHVIDNFGKGGVLIAEDPDENEPDALSAGMIDSIVTGIGAEAVTDGGEDAIATTFRDLPMIDRPWDGDAAVKRVRRFLNAEDKPNARYKQAFFWYNSEESEQFGAYKLPFVDIVGGRMVANIRGVNAANGSMAGARGQRVDIPEADRPRVQSHIDRYRDKWRKEQEKGEGGNALSDQNNIKEIKIMDLNELKSQHPGVFAAAVAIGTTEERERVEAHVTMGEAAGDLTLAMENIKSGADMNAAISAKYMASGMKNSAMTNRENEKPGNIETPSAGAEGEDVQDEAVAKALAEKLGVTIDA